MFSSKRLEGEVERRGDLLGLKVDIARGDPVMTDLMAILRRQEVLTLLLLAWCWPVCRADGWLVDLLGFNSPGLIGRVCAIFLYLSIAEIAPEPMRGKRGA